MLRKSIKPKGQFSWFQLMMHDADTEWSHLAAVIHDGNEGIRLQGGVPHAGSSYYLWMKSIMFDLVASSVLADDLAPLGTRASTSTVMTKFRSHMYVWDGHLKSQALWCPGNLSSTKVSLVGSSSWCMMRIHNGATWQLWYMVAGRKCERAFMYVYLKM